MRTLTAFLVTLLVLIGGGVGVDAVLTQRAERAAGQRLSAQLGGDVDVRLGTWPVTLHLLSGHVPQARVTLRDVAAGNVRLTVATAQLREVDLQPAAGLVLGLGEASKPLVLRPDRGRLEADFDERAVGELAQATVDLRDGKVTIASPQGGYDAVAGLEGGAVVLRPVGAAPDSADAVRFDAPALPGDARPSRVQLRRGALRLIADVRRLGE